MIGSKVAPDPFPPSTVIDNTSLISKSWGSTCISVISPVTTGWINAVVFPTPDSVTFKLGGLITS